MKLEEAIRILKLWNKAEEMTINDNDIEDKQIYQLRKEAMERLFKYIKEESIPRAVVEEKIEEYQKLNVENLEAFRKWHCRVAKIVLQELLNKGE